MVQFSALLLAATATLSVAYPSKLERPGTLIARAPPSPGDELTMQKTVNNIDDGSFTKDGGDVTFNVGDKLGEGSAGRIYAINCGDRPECNDLGRVVLKHYIDNGQVADEQKHLAKIDELKAVLTRDQDQFTLLVQWDGSNFSKLPKYNELLQDPAGNKQAINDLLDSAIAKTSEDGKAYLRNHYIFHGDISDANVLMQEADGLITSAKLVDWDKADIIPSDISEDDMKLLEEDMDKVAKDAFDRFRID